MNQHSILIIDDNEDDRYLLKRMLDEISITGKVFEADNGKTGLDLLNDYQNNCQQYPNDFPPDLIFLDINMPVLNGFGFLNQFSVLKEKYHSLSSSIIMYTSSEHQDDKTKAFSYDFVKAYIPKMSITIDELKNKLLSLI